jgi:predicted phosphodiesterase
MKIGILADIHEAVEPLERCLAALEARGADRVVALGDILEMGERIERIVELLSAAGAVGVWGNHDFGLCRDPSPEVRELVGDRAVDFFATLQPRMEIESCLFTHVPPWLNPENPIELWSPGGFAHSEESIAKSFAATRQPLLCIGHSHRWLLATPDGVLPWEGKERVRLETDSRHLLGIHAVLSGWCALLDTDDRVLTPIQVGS